MSGTVIDNTIHGGYKTSGYHMKCPFCACSDDRVLDSRPVRDNEAVRRRRECLGCGRRFTTYEYIERNALMVRKRDGRIEPYDRQKLLDGVMLALRKRPVSRGQAEELVDSVEADVVDEHRLEITSRELGELVLRRLDTLDRVAYVRFASVYRQFDSPEQFLAALGNLKKPEGE